MADTVLKSSKKAAVAVDTAERLETAGTGTKFCFGYFSLNASASGPCRLGASTVKVATSIGVELNPGDTVFWAPIPNAQNGHILDELWVAFTSNAATDILSWTVVKG